MLTVQFLPLVRNWAESTIETVWVLDQQHTDYDDMDYLAELAEVCPWGKMLVHSDQWSEDDNCWMPYSYRTTVGEYYPIVKEWWDKMQERLKTEREQLEDIPF